MPKILKPLPDLYKTYSRTVLRIQVEKQNGDLDNGTCFHIGEGYVVTAKHVVENMKSVKIISDEHEEEIEQNRFILPENPKIDLAVVKTRLCRNAFFVSNPQLSKISRAQTAIYSPPAID